jgi:hypothetical protein
VRLCRSGSCIGSLSRHAEQACLQALHSTWNL